MSGTPGVLRWSWDMVLAIIGLIAVEVAVGRAGEGCFQRWIGPMDMIGFD